ncbi:hypothetical protein HOK68_04625 [Candidatus Woesearchaeota archaeon]|jgi:hypothetical protein|nr:hypothetical protein [Candidatus Woesearchaeota archaeon]MBT4387516.1 hypothetical protein [Candidatus Woesearchaeota archaeon]MBT4595358.1 hypothetical protein [Candidatus Woesearchaeota archaeon]MBT5741237.1 hypothetical protein [Candidatus Woesearchaeota archaeon]MBT6506033.1 hypothetical protein [Candidatus Woesearchaeota archaeon]
MTINFNSNEITNIIDIIFQLETQRKVVKVLIEYLKNKKYVSKKEISHFADLLNTGKLNLLGNEYYEIKNKIKFNIKELKYNRKQFYSRILKVMINMGLVNLGLYDKKYRLSIEFIDNMNKICDLWKKELE